jgi:hypothetical protein
MSPGNIGTTGSVNYIDMPKNPLIKTNPYLKNPAERNAALTASVVTSSAIEGAHLHLDDQDTGWAVTVSPAKSPKKLKKGKSAVTCHESSGSYRSRR